MNDLHRNEFQACRGLLDGYPCSPSVLATVSSTSSPLSLSPLDETAYTSFVHGSAATYSNGPVTESPTPTTSTQPVPPRAGDGSDTMARSNTLTIVLATTLPSVVLISVAAYLCYRMQKRKASRIFKRGITPIEDEEIESWKTDRNEEKELLPEPVAPEPQPKPTTHTPQHHHQQSNSVSSILKPPSVIVYQNQGVPRLSEEHPQRCLHHHKGSSLDMPQTPVLARAPNARPGLTDDTVRGDDAFIPQLKRQPSRLAKSQPASPRHARTRSARSSLSREQWHGQNQEPHQISPRRSAESFPTTPTHSSKHKRLHSSSQPPRMSLDEDHSPGGLSPRPLIRKSEIGRAIG